MAGARLLPVLDLGLYYTGRRVGNPTYGEVCGLGRDFAGVSQSMSGILGTQRARRWPKTGLPSHAQT